MADEFIFDVPSSDGVNNYSVAISIVDRDELVIRCNCKAGVLGKLCKHKIAVLSANMSETGAEGVPTNRTHTGVGTILCRSILGAAFRRYMNAETQFEYAKKAFDQEKKSIEFAMKAFHK